jgi:hypothetical protein
MLFMFDIVPPFRDSARRDILIREPVVRVDMLLWCRSHDRPLPSLIRSSELVSWPKNTEPTLTYNLIPLTNRRPSRTSVESGRFPKADDRFSERKRPRAQRPISHVATASRSRRYHKRCWRERRRLRRNGNAASRNDSRLSRRTTNRTVNTTGPATISPRNASTAGIPSHRGGCNDAMRRTSHRLSFQRCVRHNFVQWPMELEAITSPAVPKKFVASSAHARRDGGIARPGAFAGLS